jgi:hypothetical protein
LRIFPEDARTGRPVLGGKPDYRNCKRSMVSEHPVASVRQPDKKI